MNCDFCDKEASIVYWLYVVTDADDVKGYKYHGRCLVMKLKHYYSIGGHVFVNLQTEGPELKSTTSSSK
jgi:hypothetical protein